MDNPLEINFPVIYPENSTVFAFRNYISRILNNKSVAFDPDFIQYLILPHRVNILHILTYCMKSRELRLAIKAGG